MVSIATPLGDGRFWWQLPSRPRHSQPMGVAAFNKTLFIKTESRPDVARWL